MYLQSKLKEEIDELRIIVGRKIKDRHKITQTFMEKLLFPDYIHLNRRCTRLYTVNYEKLPILNIISKYQQMQKNKTLENKEINHANTFAKMLITILCTELELEIVWQDEKETHIKKLIGLTNNIYALLTQIENEADLYKITCNFLAINPERILSIRGIQTDFFDDMRIWLESEDYVIEIYCGEVKMYKIGEDYFEFKGETYLACPESIQIIDWLHYGTGYFLETLYEQASCN